MQHTVKNSKLKVSLPLKSILHGRSLESCCIAGEAHLKTLEKLVRQEKLMRVSVRKEDEDEVAQFFAKSR